jgi:hypothetical protein
MTKTCRRCKKDVPSSEFRADLRNRDGLFCWCIPCDREYHNARNAANPDIARQNNLNKYGITIAEYDEMFASQGGCCAICGGSTRERLHVDHDHETGQVRMLLCRRCNMMLGHSTDDPELLEAAADYLRMHK